MKARNKRERKAQAKICFLSKQQMMNNIIKGGSNQIYTYRYVTLTDIMHIQLVTQKLFYIYLKYSILLTPELEFLNYVKKRI